jgi:hypothetical protein
LLGPARLAGDLKTALQTRTLVAVIGLFPCQARVEQSKQSVFPVPVGLSSNAFSDRARHLAPFPCGGLPDEPIGFKGKVYTDVAELKSRGDAGSPFDGIPVRAAVLSRSDSFGRMAFWKSNLYTPVR